VNGHGARREDYQFGVGGQVADGGGSRLSPDEPVAEPRRFGCPAWASLSHFGTRSPDQRERPDDRVDVQLAVQGAPQKRSGAAKMSAPYGPGIET
jgi:hypothetical protein